METCFKIVYRARLKKRIDAIQRVFADPNNPDQQVAATKQFAVDLANTMETSLGFARKMSEDLWGKVDDTVVYTAEDIINGGVVPEYIQAYDDLIKRMEPGFERKMVARKCCYCRKC